MIIDPDVANMPPLARIVCAPMMTLFTQAYIEKSGMRKVDMPDCVRQIWKKVVRTKFVINRS